MDAVLQWSLARLAGGQVSCIDLLEVEVMNRRLLAVMMVSISPLGISFFFFIHIFVYKKTQEDVKNIVFY